MRLATIFNVERTNYGRTIEIRWLTRHPGEPRNGDIESVATKVEYQVTTPENMDIPLSAPLTIRPDDAQCLMDELWRAGFRPTEGTGSAGSLAATERHLKDMQRIAFRLLEDEMRTEATAQQLEVKF